MSVNGHRSFVHVHGTDLHWTELGSGPPLILLHGLTDSHRSWRLAAPILARTHRVLMPDLPGHGLSGRPDTSYSIEWYAQVIRAWLDHLKIESADFVGHSFGGGIAQILVRDDRPRIRRLCLVSSGGLGREVLVLLRLAAATPGLVDPIVQPLMSTGTRIAMPILGHHFSNDDVTHLSWMNAMPGTARALGRTVRGVISWRGQRKTLFDHAHELNDLPPIAVFWGDRDPVVPFKHGVAMAKRFHHVTLQRFDRCGHYPHHERAEDFARHLLAFLDDDQALPARFKLTPALPRRSWSPRKTLPSCPGWARRAMCSSRHNALVSTSFLLHLTKINAWVSKIIGTTKSGIVENGNDRIVPSMSGSFSNTINRCAVNITSKMSASARVFHPSTNRFAPIEPIRVANRPATSDSPPARRSP
jgi:pimeloyl-ACP methyl ester carboxylesterase